MYVLVWILERLTRWCVVWSRCHTAQANKCVPDAILGLGFTDDLAALAWALFKIKKYITPEIERKARERLRQWFGPEEGEEFDLTIPHYNPNDPRIIDVEAEEY